MQEEINLLKTKVKELEARLTNVGMPYELKEIMRNEVIGGLSTTTTLTQVYTDSNNDTVTAPKEYNGALILVWKGRQYVVPTILNT